MTNQNLKVLFYDVETKPVKAWIWRTGNKIRIGHEQLVKGEKFDIITICYKWLGERTVHSLDWGLKAQDSSRMIEQFSKIIESADLTVGHNGDRFDQLQINTQRLLHNQDPIAWPSSEDTLKQFRKHFYFPSYKLDYISKLLTGGGKDRMSFEDWIDICEDKNPKALAKMIAYCKKDVLKLEQIYKQASKFFAPKIHAGIALRDDRDCCPRCGSRAALSKGHRITIGGRYRRLQCMGCGSSYRSRKKVLSGIIWHGRKP